jgi:hypothetical protein
MDPDPDHAPTPDPTPFFSDFKDAKKLFFSILFSDSLPADTLSSVLKINFLLKFCVKILFCKHYFNPLNIFMRKGKDPDPDFIPLTNGSGRPKNMLVPFPEKILWKSDLCSGKSGR